MSINVSNVVDKVNADAYLQPEIIYPDSDGKPMSDNTKQFRWIVTVKEGLENLFRKDPDVFVAGDLLWYPVEGSPKIRLAPDAMVVLGRPKGDRGSYMQFREENIPPHVVFEILSPGNRPREMEKKWRFYNRYGVKEYYIYDPDHNTIEGWVRPDVDDDLVIIDTIRFDDGWKSPLLQITMRLTDETLQVIRPDGEPFVTFVEMAEQVEHARLDANRAHEQAERAHEHAEQEHIRAEQAHERAEQERIRAEQANERAERLAAQLREMGIDPETING